MIPEDTIIVIGRQYGGGGRKIGQLLAKDLGLTYYDKELLQEAATSMGFATDIFTQADEKRPSFFHRLVPSSYGLTDGFPTDPMSAEGIYGAQARVISKLGEKGSCVIVGRTADHILRHHPHLVSIFLHAPIATRVANIQNRGEESMEKKCIDLAEKRDRQREAFYNYFTGRRWGHAANYDLTLDSSLLSPDEAVAMIKSFAEAKLKR